MQKSLASETTYSKRNKFFIYLYINYSFFAIFITYFLYYLNVNINRMICNKFSVCFSIVCKNTWNIENKYLTNKINFHIYFK